MQAFDDFFFNSKLSSKSETLENLKSSILNEYLHDLSSQKLVKLSSIPQKLQLSDITSWIYSKTYITSTTEAKGLWMIIVNGDDKISELAFEDFFKRYAEFLYDKHQKSLNLRRKMQKILKLKRRTSKYIECLDNLLKELCYKGQISPKKILLGKKGQKYNFLINVDCLENFDMTNIFKDKDYLGHHIELGYKDSVVFTPTEATNGRIVNFRNIQLGLNLEYMIGNIFINIYEDFLRETKIDKNLIARRNLDIFSSLTKTFIVKILLKELKDEALLKKFTMLFEELGLEEEERGEESKENNFRLLKKDGKIAILDDQIQNVSQNCTQELLNAELITEKFKLFKMTNSIHNPYVFLKLYISCENLKDLDDLGQYKEMMGLRKDFLVKKAEKTLKKISYYKLVIENLILPLRSVVLTENDIRIDIKFLKSQHQMMNENILQNTRKTCQIF